MTVDLNATFGHRLLCIRDDAATFISRGNTEPIIFKEVFL